MKERPILFSSAMVRAILDGRKTQTRRICKQADFSNGIGDTRFWAKSVHPAKLSGWIAWDGLHADRPQMAEETQRLYDCGFLCPYGQSDDRLWVRETWGITSAIPMGFQRRAIDDQGATLEKGDMAYRADNPTGRYDWRPSIHMPRWASRLTLELTGVRVERVQDISETDMRAEGLGIADYGDPARGFQVLWDSINAKRGYGWDVNPWCWVLEFKRLT